MTASFLLPCSGLAHDVNFDMKCRQNQAHLENHPLTISIFRVRADLHRGANF